MLEKFLEVLTRIAVVLEKAEARYAGQVPPAPVVDKPKKGKEDKPAPAAAAAPVENAVTKEVLFDRLKEHGAAFGLKATKTLMVKHGADSVNTTTASVPAASYKALFAEATKELEGSKAPQQEVFA